MIFLNFALSTPSGGATFSPNQHYNLKKIHNPQSEIHNPKSTIHNPQSEIAMGAGQKFVPNGVMLMCNGGVAPGRLNVIPKNVMLDGQIFATELDTMPFVNIPSFGACQRLRYCPPCMPAPTGWKDVCDDGVKVMGARPLLEKSTNSCAIGGKITILFVPPGGFSGSFTGITPSGLPDMSALTGGNGLASLASNPAAAISNVGGVASLANVGSGGLASITNLGSNVLSSTAGGVNALRQAASGQASGMLGNLVGNLAGGLSNITNRLGEIVAPMQKTLEQGAKLMDNLQKGANRINELGGVLSHKSLQDAAQKWAAQLQKNHGYLDSIAKTGKYLQEGSIASSDFFKKFKAVSDNNQLGAKWDTFIEKLGNGAKNFFNHFQKVPKQYDTVGEWLQMAKTGVKEVASEAATIAKDLSGATKYLTASSSRIKTFGGVISAISRNPAAQETANRWAVQLDNIAKNTENARYKIQILPTLVDYAQESSAFFEKYIQQQPSGNPFQNWGDRVSSWITELKNKPIEPPRAGSVKELLGDLSKITDNLEHGFEKVKVDFGRKTVHLNNLSGVLSLVDKNAASKMQDWSNKAKQLEQEANKIAEQAKSWKKNIEFAQNAKKHWEQALADAKKDLEKAKAYWNKMKEKLPNFSKGANLLQQSLPKLPEVASIAAISKAFPAMDSIANASHVANLPIANAFSASITNSFANVSSNNVFTNNTTSSVTQTGAVKAGSASVSASGGGGMGVVNGSSRIGTVTVQKVSVSLPDMSDKNPNEPKKQNNNAVAPQPTSIKPVGSKLDSMARKQSIEMAIAKNKAEREMKLTAQKLQQQIDNEADRKKVESLRWETEEKMLKRALDDKSKKDAEPKKQLSEGTHAILSGLGFIPAVGTIAGVLDTSLYAIEGDWTNAGIAALAMIPVFGSIAKMGVKNGRKVLEISGAGIHQLNKLDKVQLDNIVRQIKTVKKSSKTVSKGVIEISKEMKTINIGAKDWKKTLKFTTEQEGIVYILKDSKGAILKIGKTTRHNIDGRFSKYLTYANKTGKNLSADIFTIEKNNIRSIESVESEIRKAWGADKVLPWDNSKRRLGRKGSGLPKL